MPQVKKEYEVVEEYQSIASALVNKYPEVFGEMDVTKLRCVAIMNKDRKNDKLWEVRPVPMPIRMDCPYAYYITIFNKDWVEMDEIRRQYLVADTLHAIPDSEDEEGKVIAHDAKYYNPMLRTFGPDFMENAKLKNMLESEVKWVI